MEKVSLETCQEILSQRALVYGLFSGKMDTYAQCMDAIEVAKVTTYYSAKVKRDRQVAEMLKGLIALKAARILTVPDSEVSTINDSYTDLVNYFCLTRELKHYRIVLKSELFNAKLSEIRTLSIEQICEIINSEGLFAKGVEYASL